MGPADSQRASASTAAQTSPVPDEQDEDNGYGYRSALCPACREDNLYHVEDVPAMRPVRGFDADGVIHIDGCVDSHDYDGGHDGQLECHSCGWTGPEPDVIEWE